MTMFETTLAITALAGAGISAACIAPQVRRVLSVPRMQDRARHQRMVCLTYDDGPGPILTAQLLDVLKHAGVRATFYLLGTRAVQTPDLPTRAKEEGHELGVHTMWHRHAWRCTPWSAFADVEAGYKAVRPWVGEAGRFRPPYGKLSVGSWLAVRLRRAPIDWWTIDSGDTWETLPDPRSIVDKVVAARGGVVLLHDFDRQRKEQERANYVLTVTQGLIKQGKQVGLTFGTMSELDRSESG